MKNIKFILSTFLLLITHAASAHFGSKGPFGGSVTCSTTIADTVYIGTAEGGVYESTNNTLVGWRARVVGLKSGKIKSLAHTGKYLFAATADSGVFVFNGYAGSDRYWKKVNNGLTDLNTTSLIAIDQNTLMVGTTSGVFISTNLGATWTAVNNGLHHLEVTGFAKAGSRVFVLLEDGGVYYSDDNGSNWSSFNDSNTDDIAGSRAMSYNATTDELMVLNETGLYVAQNVSSTTTPSYMFVSTTLDPDATINSISSTSTDWYLTSDSLVYTSPVGSIQWVKMNTGLEKIKNRRATTFLPFKNFFVLGTIEDGIYKSSTPFVTWSQMNTGLNNLFTRSFASSGLGFIITANEKGIFVSKDLATTYVRANNGLLDSLNVQDVIIAEHYVFAATKYNGVFVTADSGANWSEVNAGMIDLTIKKLFYSNGALYAFNASNEIFVSNSLTSISWNKIQLGLPVNVQLSSITCMNNNVVLSTNGNGVFVKSISNNSWIEYNTGLTNLNTTSLTTFGNKLFVGTNGNGVFVTDTTLSLINWAQTSSVTIPHLSLVQLDPTKIQAMSTYGNYIFASYKGGVVASIDNGTTWIPAGNQFNYPSFSDVNKIEFVTTRLFVSSENNSLYSNALVELPNFILTNTRASVMKSDVFFASPNPSNGIFTLQLNKIQNKIESIEVFNTMGEKLQSTSNTVEQIQIQNGRGVYYVVIKTIDQQSYVQKVIVE